MNKLLRDVMMDACQKMRGEEVSELLFLTILEMIDLMMRVNKEGMFELIEALESEDFPKELKDVFAIPLGIELSVDGEGYEHMTEILVTRYWVNNPQGVYAMANYIVIRALNAIDKVEYGNNWMSLERLLTACLPDGCEEKYQEYKEKHFPQFRRKKPKEELMEKEIDLSEKDGFIVTVKNKLEKKIMEVPEDMLKSFIDVQIASREKQYQLEIAIGKGLSNETRERLFSCMTKETEEEIIDNTICMWLLRLCDVMDALTYLLIEIMEYEKRWNAA